MLIDAGAQVLEMDNISLAKAWLTIDHEAPAAVYFNTENKPVVIYKHGLQIPLSASPFAENLGECLVYLDEAHTRGTDLKMPANARGALTLGLGQTKDQTVQAAMRLRQLATSQSVVFFAPPEVHQSILDLRRKGLHDSIDSYDVICWLLQQTCSGIEQLQPLYFSHGSDFFRRQQAALENPDFLVDVAQRDAYLHEVRQTEQQTLTQLYGPRLKSKTAKNLKAPSPQVAAFMKELNVRRKGFQDTGNAVHGSALQEVEQEREVAFEVEAVREVEKPVHYSPLSFSGLHKDIVSFMKTGRLAAGDGGYEHVSVALRRTGLGLKHGINSEAAVSRLFVSKEFMRTVSIPLGRTNDNFLRQVNWILWSVVTNAALIIIPEEAELCLSLVCDFQEPLTHLLTYAAPVTRRMLHFNNLTFYAVPSLPTGWKPPTSLTIQLGIFAGRLYFEYDEYSDICNYLNCGEDNSTKVDEPMEDATPPITKLHEQDVDEARDSPEEEGRETATSSGQQARRSITAKPLTFLQEWLAMRRKGQDFTHTPMGYVCQGKPLAANHPFFNNRVDDAGDAGSGSITVNGAGSGQGKQSAGKGNIGAAADVDTHSDPSVSSDLDYPDEEDYFIQDEDGEQEDGMYEESDRSDRSESDEKSLEEGDEESPVEDDEDDSYGSNGPQQWPSPHRPMV
ncbi:hypothetical protein GJ744_006514 [Endocarpon pusillum]|uniref:ubiquitinyl hydrolase 1 n=1 Tax=Endocarpon pusillum TaxID=364733 RepID=A0A8H7AR13_9EURO|nr:hypothetical protein GJ744_006514 [Endocarpon pusillum]